MLFPFNYAPKGWAQCNGQLLPIAQNQALFSLLGTVYGGNGQTTFALPDLRGQTAISFSSSHILGERGGQEAHTLTQQEVPAHVHQLVGTTDSATGQNATNNLLGQTAASGGVKAYSTPSQAPNTPLAPGTIQPAGGSQAHENRQPYLVLNWCIALVGIFPSRN